GESLAACLRREGRLSPRRAILLFEQLTMALVAIHEAGLIHRDLKPDNLQIEQREGQGDFLKVLDFGIVKNLAQDENLTLEGMIFGTPKYMSPEQIRGKEVDHRADLYAAGVILYQLLTGQAPFAGVGVKETMIAHLTRPIPTLPSLDLSESQSVLFQQLLTRCLAKRSVDRFESATELLRCTRALIKAHSSAESQRSSASAQLHGGWADEQTPSRSMRALESSYSESDPQPHHEDAVDSLPPTIAVLPLKNMSSDPEQLYFADGLSEDLISLLSRGRTFPVVSANSSFAFRDSSLSTGEVAAQLGARYLITGSIRRGPKKVRVTINVIDATQDQQIWSQRWDRSIDDLFEVQDEISQSVATAIMPLVHTQELQRARQPQERPTLGVWELYLKALSIFQNHRVQHQPIQDRSCFNDLCARCDELIERDPGFCDAYVLKCKVIKNIIFTNDYEDMREENEREFVKLARRAYTLDPHHPEASVMMANVYNLTKEYEKRLKLAERSLEMNPHHPLVNYDYGLALCNKGAFSESVRYIHLAIQMDPVNADYYERFLPIVYIGAGDFTQAIHYLNVLSARIMHSRYLGWLASVHGLLGDLPKAKHFLLRYQEQRPEIRSITDYAKVAPEMIKAQLLKGLRIAGLPEVSEAG
ncbi:MAG: protein kinase, partial [Myxococcota bacterium]|nr:protein kinase [Myxococcota bacterium]